MKKGLVLVSVFISLFLFSCIALVAAADVGYVLKDVDKNDSVLMGVFADMGLSVELIEDGSLSGVDFSDYSAIFVSDIRLRNAEMMPDDVPVVLMNPKYAEMFGFLDKGRARMIASNAPLKVRKNGDVVSAYDSARYKIGGVSLPYYYLPSKYENKDCESVGKTSTNRGSGEELGNVVSYLSDEVDKCFFGIPEASYWTADARGLFENCVNFVIGGVGIHDVKIDDSYTNTVDGVRIRDVESGDYLLDTTAQLTCNKKYTISFKTLNVGDYTEDVDLSGVFGDYTWSSSKSGLAAGKSSTSGSKTVNVTSEDFEVGFYDIMIDAVIGTDNHPEDNSVSRSVEVVC